MQSNIREADAVAYRVGLSDDTSVRVKLEEKKIVRTG
jgi:hypothetical protein